MFDGADSDDDGPPELVESKDQISTFHIQQQEEVEEEAPSPQKVPITIVTGKYAAMRHAPCSKL